MWFEVRVISEMTATRERNFEGYIEDYFTEQEIDELNIKEMDEDALVELLTDRLYGADLEWPVQNEDLLQAASDTYPNFMNIEHDIVEAVEMDEWDPDEEI